MNHGVSRTGFVLMCLLQSAAEGAEVVRGAGAAAPPDPISAGTLVQVVLGLGIILALIVGGALVLRRMGYWQMSHSGALKIVAGMSIGPRERIIVVQVGEQQLLLGITPGRIASLAELKDRLVVREPGMPEIPFKNRLMGILHDRYGKDV